MSTQGMYDADELRALALALDALDSEDPDEWEGDSGAFGASVRRGRERLQQRGVATFARDGGAVVESEDVGALRAFLAPDAVIEAWVVDGSAALQREWYVGPEVTVVADPAGAADGDEQELTTIDTREVFTDVAAFLDIRGVNGGGNPVRIDGDAIDEFNGYPAATDEPQRPAARLMNVSAAWARNPTQHDLQLLDAGLGGVWVVSAADREARTDADARAYDGGRAELIDLTPASWRDIVERLFAALTAPPPLMGTGRWD